MKKPLQLNFKDINPKKTLLLVIDLQNDFCHQKSNYKRKTTRNVKCALAVYKFIEEAKKQGIEVAFSQQIYDETKITERQKEYYKRQGFILCRKDSFGAEYYNYQPPKNRLFIKYGYDIWRNKLFAKFLSDKKIETLIITGVEIPYCVLYAILGAEEGGFKIVVPKDLVSGADKNRKEYTVLLNLIEKFYGPKQKVVVSSKEILEIWNKYHKNTIQLSG